MNQPDIVYVVDDDSGARSALVTIVESMQLRAVPCSDAEEFLTLFTEDSPSCLLTDLRMRGMSGLDLLRHMRASKRVVPTVIISGYAETPIAVDAMLAGAVTFLEKTASAKSISDAITVALTLSRQLLARKAERTRIVTVWASINTEERQILQMVAQGKLNKEIAFQVGVPLRTIEDRRRRLMAKVGADSIADLIRFAVRVEDLDQSSFIDKV
jgi:two-component system response regulator FixJ